jgi:hypothetical protein
MAQIKLPKLSKLEFSVMMGGGQLYWMGCKVHSWLVNIVTLRFIFSACCGRVVVDVVVVLTFSSRYIVSGKKL